MGLLKTNIYRVSNCLNRIYILGLFLGSAVFIGIPTFSLQNIFFIPATVINLIIVSKTKYSNYLLYPILWLCIYMVIITVNTLLLHDVEDNIKALLYQYQILGVFLIPVANPKILNSFGIRMTKYMIIVWFLWAIIQAGIILGIVPSSFDFLFSRSAREFDPEAILQINGPFGNANDFGCVALLVYLIIFNSNIKNIYGNIYFYLVLLIIIMTISRTAMVLFLLLIPLRDWLLGYGKKLMRIVIITMLVFISLASTKDLWAPTIDRKLEKEYGYSAITINFRRITSILSITDKHTEDGSVEYRSASYKYAMENLPTQISSLGYQNYKDFYLKGNFTNQLVWRNPHSFLIEVGIAYGVPALLCFMIFLATIIISVHRSSINPIKKRYLYLSTFYTIILSNVPSSIFLMPIFWIPLFFLYVNQINKVEN